MAEGHDDELLGRLRRANPVAGRTERATDAARAEVLFLRPRRRWRRRRRRLAGEGGDGALDLLRAVNPAPTATADLRAERHAAELFAALTAADAKRRRRPARARRGVAILITLAASVGASAFGYVFAQRNVTYSAAVRCYEEDSLGAASVGITEAGAGAVETCRADVWAKGGFGKPSSPPLVGCVLADGVEGVFPGRDDALCTRLDLSAALPPTEEAERFAALRQRLITDLDPDDRCLSTAAARRVVRADLAGAGVTGWTVRIGAGASPQRPCTQAFLDAGSKVIELLQFPRLVDHHPIGASGTSGTGGAAG